MRCCRALESPSRWGLPRLNSTAAWPFTPRPARSLSPCADFFFLFFSLFFTSFFFGSTQKAGGMRVGKPGPSHPVAKAKKEDQPVPQETQASELAEKLHEPYPEAKAVREQKAKEKNRPFTKHGLSVPKEVRHATNPHRMLLRSDKNAGRYVASVHAE
eukprot:m.26404 g.26404  ORF g.26404 m.26404 type:complete len:158 (+) comp11507_c0_seq3:1334-1807(+)